MKGMIKRIIALVLTLSMLLWILPVNEIKAAAASEDVVSMSNDYITVDVSGKNGGFSIKTDKGDKLVKSDDNKDLLYHNDEYDTSFTSFEVTYADGSTEQYLFGGSYGFLGMSSSDVEVTKVSDREIHAVWRINDLTFTQKLTLVSSGANEHGMVSIAYDVVNSGKEDVSVKARVLLDTALGKQDYAHYQMIDENNNYQSIKTENIIPASGNIPQNFFAYDDPYNPTIVAYTVSKQGQTPYQVAFGHWNNLASTLFSFAPDSSFDFTDKYNKYLTADSAYALYYDMGSISAAKGTGTLITYYGVYSHEDANIENTMSIDVSAPTSLKLDDDRKDYVPLVNMGQADFSVETVINNLLESGKDYSSITLAVYTASGLMPLDEKGMSVNGVDYDTIDPYTRSYVNVVAGQTILDSVYMAAKPASEAEFRKIRFQAYDTSESGTLTADKMLGEKVFYILCPGTNGDLPKYTFTSISPDIIYYEGTRHLFVTGTNIDILYTSIQSGQCVVKAYGGGEKQVSINIPKSNVLQPDKNKLDIILTEEMMVGSWFLQFEFSDGAVKEGIVTADQQKLSSDVLSFTVSDDEQYRSDIYGVIAIVQLDVDKEPPAYRIRSFSDESSFQEYKEKGIKQEDGTYEKDYEEILIELRGEFEIEESIYEPLTKSYQPTKLKATSVKGEDGKITNCITINNCIDFEDGVLTVFYTENEVGAFGDIHVHFDGSLYTSNARTSIWKGEAAFTKIIQGVEYGLIQFDENGEREEEEKSTGEPICLVWPSVLGVAQTIAGMAFKLAYGQLGVMIEEENGKEKEVGRVISFSAKLDLGFLIPAGKSEEKEDTYWTRLQGFWRWYKYGERGEYADWVYENYDKGLVEFATENENENTGAASVMVQNILFGCGVGFVGVNFKVKIAIPNYIEAMPRIEGELEVNTINNWKVALEGKMNLASIAMEVALTLKSYKNIPIPDKIYFYIGGFEPGINVDGFGVIWITGGGGGIDELYDTIFLSNGIPPLKLLLSVSFDLLKVLSARADFEFSLRGLKFSAQDVKIKVTNTLALKKLGIQLDWYPDFAFKGNLSVSLYDIISGAGYIVVEGEDYSDWFFEIFVRAGVAIPKSIPLIGGLNLAEVNLGLNSNKIWGKVDTFLTSVGITYYWGGDFDFGKGDYVKPSYPELLGFEDVPVYYDEEKDQTLYMRVGTNLSVAALPEITDDPGDAPRLMAGPTVYSDGERKTHKFNLGVRSGSNDAIISITYDAGSLEEARSLAEYIIAEGIKNEANGDEYDIKLYDGNNLKSANANVTYNSETKKGNLSFTMTSDTCFSVDWTLHTSVPSEIVVYNVEAVPEINSVSGSVADTKITLNWSGTRMDELDRVAFYLVSDNKNMEDSGYSLITLTDSAEIDSGTTAFSIPADIPSGSYYLRAVYSQDDVLKETVTSNDKITVENKNTPEPASITQIKAAGDLKFDISLNDPTADAYIVNIYQYDADSKSWIYSDVNEVAVEKADMVNNTIRAGGSYVVTDDKGNTAVKGLAANTQYRIGVIACKYLKNGDDGKYTVISSEERFYSSSGSVTDISKATSVSLPEPKPAVISITADKAPVIVQRKIDNQNENYDCYASKDITFNVTADQNIDATWTIDGNKDIKDSDGNSSPLTGTVKGKSDKISLNGLTEGDHTLIIQGTGANGDGFRHTYTFSVDTLAPRLLLSSPINGSFFNEDGTLTVTGVTDADALFSVYCDGAAICRNKSITDLKGTIDSDGGFSFKVSLPDAHKASSHKITIMASDEIGNTTRGEEVEVVHGGLADIQSLEIYANGVRWENNNLMSDPLNTKTYQLSLSARTKNGISFFLTDDKFVSWDCNTVNGTATVDQDGTLTVGAGSIGYVTGSLRVTDTHSLTSDMTFGAERFSSGFYSVVTSATQGGKVTGGGVYAPGESVILTAIPDSGYEFAGWTLDGVSVKDASKSTISFTMPGRNVVVTAKFNWKSNTPGSGGTSGTGDSRDDDETTQSTYSLTANAGQKVYFKIPSTLDANCFVPYYMVDGRKVYVPMSADENGVLVFIAPVTGKYFMNERAISFVDTEKHWAKDYIRFAAARGLFVGAGGSEFIPAGIMTRAMFVTVLWRLAGEPEGGKSEFRDAARGSYYSEALAWASNNGIVNGYGNGLFGVDDKITREQICAIFTRFLKYMGYDFSEAEAAETPFADNDAISPLMIQSVELCRRLGIVNGKPENMFDPKAYATRAECCTMLVRLIRVILSDAD